MSDLFMYSSQCHRMVHLRLAVDETLGFIQTMNVYTKHELIVVTIDIHRQTDAKHTQTGEKWLKGKTYFFVREMK